MLTIQSGNFNRYSYTSAPAFGTSKKKAKTAEEIAEELREKELEEQRKKEEQYEETRSKIEDIKDDVLDLVDDAPKPIKTAGKTLAISASALLGGMAIGWGGKKTISGIKELLKSDAGVKFTTKIKDGFTAVKDAFKNSKDFVKTEYKKVKTDFKQTNFYNKSKTKYDNFFENTTFGKKLVSIKNKIKDNSVYQKVTGGISDAYKWCKNGITNTYRKIAGIKGEQVEKATVNTLGVSGGVASGVTALKEQSKENEDY